MEPFGEYESYDGTGLAELVRDKEVHPKELILAAIERIERLNPALNAVIHTNYLSAQQAADTVSPAAPFTGVPFLIKDLGAVHAGIPHTRSSRSRRHHVPDEDNEIVRRFKEAGLLIIGKTNTPEFGLSPVTEPELHGPTHNPWDTSRTPCGSSGGSAAAVAAGIVPLAHANDGGGSIRMPASACGLFGIKPTKGRSTWGPDYVESWLGLAEQHAVTRSVRDSARLLDATHGAEPGATHAPAPPVRPFADEVGADPGTLRIAVTAGALLDHRPIHIDCTAAVDDTVRLCEQLGHEVESATPDLDIDELIDAFVTLAAAEAHFQVMEAAELDRSKARAEDYELVTWILHLIGKKRSAGELERAIHTIQMAGREVALFMRDYDVMLSATLAQPPWLIGELDPSPMEVRLLQAVRRAPARILLEQVVKQLSDEVLEPMPNTPLFNMTGQPAMSVPLHWNGQGLPVGVQFAGRLGDEATLFRLAGQLEHARPWADRRPEMGE